MGAGAPGSQTVTVTDAQNPVLTCPTVSTLCYNTAGTYTIPALSATDNCGIATTTYAVTGATTRTGNGNNATGAFSPGASIVTWTIRDVNGNTNTCQTTVTINPQITVSIPDAKVLSKGVDVNTIYMAPASSITLTATVANISHSIK